MFRNYVRQQFSLEFLVFLNGQFESSLTTSDLFYYILVRPILTWFLSGYNQDK